MLKRRGNICSLQVHKRRDLHGRRRIPGNFGISKEERIASPKIPRLVKYMAT
jgi:hypothetical protein